MAKIVNHLVTNRPCKFLVEVTDDKGHVKRKVVENDKLKDSHEIIAVQCAHTKDCCETNTYKCRHNDRIVPPAKRLKVKFGALACFSGSEVSPSKAAAVTQMLADWELDINKYSA